jgi:hypothetical protein
MTISPINSNTNLSSSLLNLAGVLQATAVNMPGMTINPSITGIAGTDTKVAQALMICLAQLRGPHKKYSSSFLNSTSLDSSQSIKVFLLTLMEALDFEHQKSAVSSIDFPSHPNITESGYAHFHHPQAQTLLEDELLDLIDDINAMQQTKTKSNNPVKDLELAAQSMFQNTGLTMNDHSLANLLGQMEKLVIGSSNTGNFFSSQA